MAYNENINLFVTTDRNNADVFNAPLEKIIQNIQDTREYLYQLQSELDQLELRIQSEYTPTEQLNDLLANGVKGDKGDNGESLEYNWDGTALGVKLESESDFTYRDLKGDPGDVSTEQLEEALTDYPTLEYLGEVKTELENEIANIPKVTKTSELTNDSGFITEVDLEPYAFKTQIPTTLPASDVYTWAKAATKPTYTASEVGALASNGTAVNASKVSNALTVSLNGTSQGAYNGSAVKNINITAASVGALPNVGAGGVHELGQYLDLHKGGSTADFDARISVDTNNQIILSDAYGSLITNYEINNLKSTCATKTYVQQQINNLANGGISVIKSIQRGTSIIESGDSYRDVRITAVNVNKTMVNYLGFTGANNDSSSYHRDRCYIRLQDSTTLTISRASSDGSDYRCSWEVIEFY